MAALAAEKYGVALRAGHLENRHVEYQCTMINMTFSTLSAPK